MKRINILLSLIFLFILSINLYSQSYTSITATLTDGNGQVWSNASVTATIVAPFGNPAPLTNGGVAPSSPVSGFTNGSGTINLQLDDNTVVTPSGSTWKFTLCPNATVSSCSTSIQVVHGATMNLSSSLNNDLVVPTVNAAPSIYRAYNDSEVTAGQGAIYWRVTDNSLRGYNGSSFIAIGSGGGGGSSSWNSIISPTANLTLAMNNFTTQFNMGTTGATGSAFDITDSTSNSGTNYLFRVWTGTSSTAKPFTSCAGGTTNCIEFNASAILQALGAAQINANNVINTSSGIGVLQLGSNGSGSVSQSNTVKLTGNSNKWYASENGGSLLKVLLGSQLTCSAGNAIQSTDNNGAVTCFNILGGNNTYTGANIFGLIRSAILQQETATNNDMSGSLAFSGGTTSATYTFTIGTAHNCIVTPVASPGTTAYWISSQGTTLQLTSSANLNITFNYICIGQATY